MSIASDIAAYGIATKRVVASTSSVVLGGVAGLVGEALDGRENSVALYPDASGVFWNVGTASTATFAIPPSTGIAITRNPAAIGAVELYAAAATAVSVTFAAPGTGILFGGGA